MTAAQLGPVSRRVIPGISDLLFLALFVSGLGPRLFADGDTGWHLWAGAEALRHGPRLIPDTLSFTRAGLPWRDVQWLGDLLLALLQRHAGYLGVALLTSLVFAATFTWLYRIVVRETDHPPAAVVATLLAAMVASLQLLARPLVFALPLVLAAWELTRNAGRERMAVVLLPALTVLWANVHPTAFVAPAFGALAWVTRGRSRALALATLLSIAALGVTPWGYGWLAEVLPFSAGARLLARVDEWRAPNFAEPRFAIVLLFVLLAVAVRGVGGPLRPGEALVGLLALAATLRSARLAPLAAIVWAPRLAEDLGRWATAGGGGAPGRLWRAAREGLTPFERVWKPGLWPALIAVVAIATAPALRPLFPDTAAGFPVTIFPRDALRQAEHLRLGPRVFNNYSWGGPIGFEHHDRWKTFIDGRAGFFGPGVLRDYLEVFDFGDGWLEALERARPDWVLMPPEAALVRGAPLTGRWRSIYADSVAVILVPTASRADGTR